MNKNQYEILEYSKIQELNDKYLDVDNASELSSANISARMYIFNKELDEFYRQSVFDVIAEDDVNLWATRFKLAKTAYKWSKNCASVCYEMDRIWHAKETARRWEKAMNAILRKYAIVKSMYAFKKKVVEPDTKKLAEIVDVMSTEQLNRMIASCETY